MKTIYLSFILLLLVFSSCSEKELQPISSSLGKPGVVTDVVVEPSAGGATISYKIPNSEDLLAVKCLYTLPNGKEQEATASFYENELLIQGYNDTAEHTAVLYAVNRAQELSAPVEVKFHPLESPLNKSTKTVSIDADFGGARFNWRNPEKVPLNVEFFGPDSLGQMSMLKVLTTDIDKNTYTIRGYDPKQYKFSMVMSDNYNNYSDTISAEITPMFEEKLDKRKMSVMNLGNDKSLTNWEGMDAFILDDDHSTFGYFGANTLPGASMTFNLGAVAKLSRFVVHQRANTGYYQHGNPKKMEIYTCDHKPGQDGDWSEWTKVMDCELVKPSGSPGNTITDLDMETAKNGHEFSFDISLPATQYIRFVILSAWDGTTYCNIADLDFYGDIHK